MSEFQFQLDLLHRGILADAFLAMDLQTMQTTEDVSAYPLLAVSNCCTYFALALQDQVSVTFAADAKKRHTTHTFRVESHQTGDNVTALIWMDTEFIWGRTSQRDDFILLVGLKSGIIKAFTPLGVCVVTQWIHTGPVLRMRLCPSDHFARKAHELLCVFRDVLVLVGGDSLAPLLTISGNNPHYSPSNKSNQSATDILNLANPNTNLPPAETKTSLTFKKWQPANQMSLNDAELCGSLLPPPLTSAWQPYRLNPFVLAAGSRPFLAHYAPPDVDEGKYSTRYHYHSIHFGKSACTEQYT
jgi:hypothetical protein